MRNEEQPSTFDKALADFMSIIVEAFVDFQPKDHSHSSPEEVLRHRLEIYLLDKTNDSRNFQAVRHFHESLLDAISDEIQNRKTYS